MTSCAPIQIFRAGPLRLTLTIGKKVFRKRSLRKDLTALNVLISDRVSDRLAEEAAGSPQLMQTLCLNACFEANIASRSLSQTRLPSDDSFLKKVCVITSVTTDFASVVNKIKEGPKQRGSTRISYRLSDGSTRDVYPIILKALALDPSQLNHPYQQLNDRIKGVKWLARTKAGQSADQRKEEVSKLFAKWKQAIYDTIKSASNTLFITAAGNSDSDTGFLQDVSASLELPNLITVGATNRFGLLNLDRNTS
jgi:hypothetical protein